MTVIKIKKQNDKIVCVECSGHTGFAPSGKDIVCAGLSCIIQTAVSSIKKLTDIDSKYVVNIESGYLKFELCNFDSTSQAFHDAQIILRSMLCGVEDLCSQYSKYIKLEVK